MFATPQRRRRALRAAAPVAGLLAAALLVWQGSYAAFSATTDNGTEAWSTGSLTLVNTPGTGTYAASTTPVFNETNLTIPSATVSKCVTVKAGGTLGGTLNFYRGALTGSAGLATQVSLTIKRSAVAAVDPAIPANCTGFVSAATIATTNLNALPTTYGTGLGSVVVPVGTQFVVYQFTYQVVTTGSNAGDNALQGTSASAPFNWEIQ
jgi:hypothetical protein